MKSFTSCFFLVLLLSCSQREFKSVSETNHAPKVVEVYPSADSLPENLLRFYVQFSESMKAVNNLENIKLVNEKGQEIVGAIFNNVYELWDSEQKHLTLILDLARVKTGLMANENLGRALVPGEHFQLIIEKAEDIHGKPIEQPFVKEFFVTKADTVMPDVTKWKIIPPISNSKSPLQIAFPQVLDRLSLLNNLRLLDANNEIVKGKIEVTQKEKEWQFTPEEAWKKEDYTLKINSRLEDPAGNNLNGLFDHKIGTLKNSREGKIIELMVKVE